ncbi:glycosyltransferase family 20-domain-containing protein [Protomyces lactucae-debilis]|uniref:Glycosyltransferase family 20-domain-containing protein n=1 Tax=Protomyces lactucae-debilis TaxID=2754530 RepID=A0A1Y2FI12_PROLT|nr:glycosyltransferase family 20-domain-containing protein [Protomyces lactucae-debilis]ORY82445.1 glycosyltransferase family 20-domain-containing protein [Protomyces lactucae-debilis]
MSAESFDSVSHPTSPATAPGQLKLSGRVICAAVTIPSELSRDGEHERWLVEPRRGARAMYSSMSHLQNEAEWDTTIVGWTGEITHVNTGNGDLAASLDGETARSKEPLITSSDKAQLEQQLRAFHGPNKIEPVWLLPECTKSQGETFEQQCRWRKYADEVLWPLLHYKLWHEVTDGRQERTWWLDYVKFNQAFAERIVSIYQQGDLIFIHDFHLMLLPQLLRQRLPDANIGFFLHAPFPSSEIFRCLPKRKEILEGLLGANMVAFQSHAYVKHFVSSCTRVLGFDTTDVTVDAFGAQVAIETLPIGIDARTVARQCQAPGVETKLQIVRDSLKGKLIIIGRDRLDEVRGVLQKLQAIKRFLEEYPEWREKVVLIQITNPSVHDTVQLERDVSEIVNLINSEYGGFGSTPVHHYHKHMEDDEYFALLRSADVGLITSVRDGMNVTSLEYVMAQKDSNGPIILSEFTGTAGSLSDAIQVNPWDSLGVARAINTALVMSKQEKAVRQKGLYNYVTTHTVQAWSHAFLRRLMDNVAQNSHGQLTPLLDRKLMWDTYKCASKRLMLFDYDGTLTPIVREPSAAIPTDRMLRALKRLAADPKNEVWIISGRDQAFLEEWLGDIQELGLSAEHGSFIRYPATHQWVNLTADLDMNWQRDVVDVFQFFTERTQGSFIERKSVAITWHYRKADPDYGAFQAKECQAHLEQMVVTKYPVEILSGKANLEVRPRNINKGEIVKSLIAKYGSQTGPEFVLCAGDDKTDEDMFKMLRKVSNVPQKNIFSVTIGASSKKTSADWHLLEPKDMISTLAFMAGIEREAPDSSNL